MRYPLLQARVSQDRIRDLMDMAYRHEAKGNMIIARDAMLKARELINYTTGNKSVYRVVNAELKRLMPLANAEESARLVSNC